MVFVVAEIGVNWNGDFTILERMVQNAKNIGCNAIKLQAFNAPIVEQHPKKEMLLKTSVNEENIAQIDNLSKSIGIEWFCTPMYHEAVDFIDPYVQRYKIRNEDGKDLVNNKPSLLAEKILATDKEMIVSSETSPKESQYYNFEKIKWLYVVPKYPCEISDIDFRNISDFDGYSNHFPHIIAPITAVSLESQIIEVHITDSKQGPYVDNPVSFDYKELKELIIAIRYLEKLKR
jgi:N,N'-diacetyllegionaminate synthase